jgi:hypothetical protein
MGVPLGRIALLTLLAFGCATVRVPVTALAEPADAAGTIAPPIVELWLESSVAVPGDVARSADARARAALAASLSGLEIPATAAGATDAVLFVRERAVGLTEERRSQQTWAKVGIVVGIVVVVAAAVYLAVKGGKGSSSAAKAPPAQRPAPPVAVKPRAFPATFAGRSPVPALPQVAHAVPLPRAHRPAPIFVGFYFEFRIPPRPLVLAPEEIDDDPWGAPEPPVPLAIDAPPAPDDGGDAAAPAPPDGEPVAAVALQLPALAAVVNFPVEERGFFAGSQTALQLDLVDRTSGHVLWSKAVSAEADPLDAGQVCGLVDKALAGQSWARRVR